MIDQRNMIEGFSGFYGADVDAVLPCVVNVCKGPNGKPTLAWFLPNPDTGNMRVYMREMENDEAVAWANKLISQPIEAQSVMFRTEPNMPMGNVILTGWKGRKVGSRLKSVARAIRNEG